MLLLIVLCLLCRVSLAAFVKNNATDLSKCKVYYSRSGTAYKDFFEISDEARPNGTILDFHFSVLAVSDAHIMFAPSPHVDQGDPVYEIVIGAGNNMFSDIRRSKKAQVRATKRTPGILSAVDPVSFWIHISTEGLIEVGKEGESPPFLSWQDSDLLPLKVFSYSTWTGVEAKWYFDCPNESNNKTINSKIVVRNLTFSESLREDLLYTYDPYVRPVRDNNDFTLVSLSMMYHYINLDIYSAKLQIKGTMQMKWQDEKLKWNPNDYGNLSVLHVTSAEIWNPPLVLFNAVGSGQDYIVNDVMAVVNNEGKVSWSPAIDLEAWCDPQGLGTWPNEIHECDLLFGFIIDQYKMKLNFSNNNNSLMGKSFASGWNFVQLDLDWFAGGENLYNKTLFNVPSLYLLLRLQMDSTMYNALFYAPFAVSAVILLSMFWVCPLGYLKMILNCFQLIITSLTIVALSRYIPPHPEKVPFFVLLHSSLLIVGVVCVAINILVINLSRNDHKHLLPHRVLKILTSSVVQWSLFLPGIVKSEDCSKYGELKETTATTKISFTKQDTWILLGVVIDRIAFIILSCIVAVAIALRY